MDRKSLKLLGATAALSLVASTAQAAGFFIQENSVSSMGSAFSGSVSSADDASVVFTNPAGMTELGRGQVQAGMNILYPHSKLENDGSTAGGPDGGNPYSQTFVPNFYAAAPVTKDNSVWAGFSANAPFGLANDYGDTWFGRYDSTHTDLKVFNFQPSLAWKPADWLSLGAGVDVQTAHAELESMLNIGFGGDRLQKLEGSSTALGWNAGVQVRPLKDTSIGLTYRSAVEHNLEGTLYIRGLTPAAGIDGAAGLDLPNMASIGITQGINDKLKLMAQTTWFGWGEFQDITVNSGLGTTAYQQHYQDTVAFSLGGEYAYNPEWTFRAGYQYDPTPTRDQWRTTRTPDGNRNWFTLGSTYHVDKDVSLDFAGAYIDVGDGQVNTVNPTSGALTRANASGNVGIISAALNYKF